MKFVSKINENNEIIHTPLMRYHLSKFKKGINIVVSVEKQYNKRSLNQNAYYHMCLGIIAEYTGDSPDELHRLFKGMFLPRKDIVLNKKRYSLAGSTTELTKGQFAEYIMKISAEVALMGITLPSPEDYKNGIDEATLLTS